MYVIGILFEKRIVDDSGFPRTPDRPVELLGTRERYPRSDKTMIGARGPDFLGGSTTTTHRDNLSSRRSLRIPCSVRSLLLPLRNSPTRWPVLSSS